MATRNLHSRVQELLGVPEGDDEALKYEILRLAQELGQREGAANSERARHASDTGAYLALAELARALERSSSLEHTASLMVDHARRLTDSPLAYAGHIDSSTGALICPTMRGDVWERCRVPGKDTVFSSFGGLWGWVLDNREPVVCNDLAKDHRSTGIPAGHVPIHRFLSVPAMVDGSLVGQLSMANAARDYTSKDLEVMEHLASLYGIAIERVRDRERIRGSEERYRQLFENAEVGMYRSRADGSELLALGRGPCSG